jgi:hypothetical protein
VQVVVVGLAVDTDADVAEPRKRGIDPCHVRARRDNVGLLGEGPNICSQEFALESYGHGIVGAEVVSPCEGGADQEVVSLP